MSFKGLLVRSALALAACVIVVTVCYFFVDRPVAFFVHDHDLRRYTWLKWLTYAAVAFEPLAPCFLVLAVVRRAWGPLTRAETALMAAGLSFMITLAFKDDLKVAFGRYWPDTWINHNPSLLGDGGYGFHPFAELEPHTPGEPTHEGWYGSFPSGHTARICSIASVLWVAYRRWRAVAVLLVAAVVVGLVGMNYHFVGDIVAGGTLGWLVGVYVAAFCRLSSPVG
jgi:membrane-associated phospholipid phosphatase